MSPLEVMLLSSILLRWPSAPSLGSWLCSGSTWSRLPSISSQEKADLVLLKAHKESSAENKAKVFINRQRKGNMENL